MSNAKKAKALVTLTLVDDYHRLWPEEIKILEQAEEVLARLEKR